MTWLIMFYDQAIEFCDCIFENSNMAFELTVFTYMSDIKRTIIRIIGIYLLIVKISVVFKKVSIKEESLLVSILSSSSTNDLEAEIVLIFQPLIYFVPIDN